MKNERPLRDIEQQQLMRMCELKRAIGRKAFRTGTQDETESTLTELQKAIDGEPSALGDTAGAVIAAAETFLAA